MTASLDRLPPITEKQFQAQVLDLARILGWHTYHPFLSKWSERGWPDLAMVRPPRLVFAELKSGKGILSAAQVKWLGLLGDCPGVESYVWRPENLDAIADVLR